MKIANKITLSFLILSVILTIFATSIAYFIAKNDLERQIHARLEATVNSRLNHIQTYLMMLRASTKEFSKSVVLEDFLKKKRANLLGVNEAFDIAMTRLKRTKEANPSIFEFLLLDNNGKVIAATDKNDIGLDKSTDVFFTGAQKETYIKDAYYFGEIKKPLFAVSSPIVDSQTNLLIGVLVAKVELTDLWSIVTNRASLGRTGETYLVNKYGFMISPSRFLKNTFLKQKIDTLNFRLSLLHKSKEFIRSIEKPVVICPNYLGEMVLGTRAYIPQTQWALLAEIRTQEAFWPLTKLFILFLIVMSLVPIFTWILGIVLSRYLTEPIHKLHKGAEIIGAGNLDYKVGTPTQDEIGQLSRAFDQMANDLKQTTTPIDNLNKEIAVRKRTEEALEDWQKTFDSITDLLFIHDIDFNIVKVNKNFCNALKLKADEIIGRKCYQLLHRSDNPWPGCPFVKTKVDLNPHSEEVDGSVIGVPLLVTVSPVLNNKKELIGSIHVIKDISEIKKSQEELKKKNIELRKLDQLKSDFVSMVSHELRTPLSIIKEGISLVLEGIPGTINIKQQEILSASKNNIDRLTRIINDLLDISKIESGKLELKSEGVNLIRLIDQILLVFEPKIKEKGLVLIRDFLDKPINIFIDSDKITQVFTNLINNALKYTQKGQITISVREKGNEVECSVIDSGIGISEENLSKIFDKFQQFGRLSGPGEKGTGLGLSIAKGIIKLHKGRIWVESELNKGSKFSFILPKV